MNVKIEIATRFFFFLKGKALNNLLVQISIFVLQQLYQTLTDYDIRYYMFEILKVTYYCVCMLQ